MDLHNLSDESLRAYYESVRRQVAADTNFGGRHRLVGTAVKQDAERPTLEMNRRRLDFKPIVWPPYLNQDTDVVGTIRRAIPFNLVSR